jgi:5-deoxy-D-glucuronate isomerase
MSSAWLFRGTDRIQGRKRIIHEFNTGLEFLRYGRIVLGPGGGEEVKVESGDEEIGFVCLAGKGTITTDGQTFQLGKYDALYLPRDSRCTIASSGSFDVAEMASPASKKYPVQCVRFQEVLKNPKLVTKAGFEPYSRTIHTLIGEANVQAARLLAGVTFSKDGNWTS